MKKYLIIIALFLTSCALYAQRQEIEKIMEKGDFPSAIQYINSAYNDTNHSDRHYLLYEYYTNKLNPNVDSIEAYKHLVLYNKYSKSKKPLEPFAKEVLQTIYRHKNIEEYNRYIALTQEFKDLNSEAIRIRDQLAYENLENSNDISLYRHFVESYPNALQIDNVKNKLNQYTLEHYTENEDVDSLLYFAKTTSSESYHAKALQMADKVSFNKALKTNTIESYANYVKSFPEGAFVQRAKAYLEKVQYEHYVEKGKITDMIRYLNSHDSTDKNYAQILNKLSLLSMQNYSIMAMQKVQDIQPDSTILVRFAKRYAEDLHLESIDQMLEKFPKLKNNEDISSLRSKALVLDSLMNKGKLTIEDYKKHRSLFKSLSPHATHALFQKFDSINSLLPKKSKQNIVPSNDYNYMAFQYAKATEYNFILTDNFDIDTQNQMDKSIRFYSVCDTNGYGWTPTSKNRDIYISVYENSSWSAPSALPEPINSRYDECHAVLSKDKRMLMFSSNRTMNFGGLDIYVSFREDVNSWDKWSEPILLSEDFNTVDNDYVVAIIDGALVISQDDNLSAENNIFLQGNTHFPIISGHLQANDNIPMERTKIYLLDKENLSLKTIIHPNNGGYYSIIRPNTDILMYCQRKGFYSPLDTVARLYNIEEMANKSIIITLPSPFDDNGNWTSQGKKQLELLYKSLLGTGYILTIGVHAVKSTAKFNEMELSERQAKHITDHLIKLGMERENMAITSYGKDNTMQGWENVNSIDIGIIKK